MSTSTLSRTPVAPGPSRIARPAPARRPRKRNPVPRTLGRSVVAPVRPVRACGIGAAQLVDAAAVAAGRPPVRPELQLTRRGRVVIAVVILTLAVAVAALSWGQTSGATATRGVVTYETVTVRPGQSLWEIARAAAPADDTRSTVSRIVDLNGLPESGAVRAGQQITVPASR